MAAQDTAAAEAIVELVRALESTLWVLEHPEVNAIKFCGSPRHLAERVKEVVAKHKRVEVNDGIQ